MNLRRLFRCAGGAFTPSPAPSPAPTPTPTPTSFTGDPTRMLTANQTLHTSLLSSLSNEWAGIPANASFASDTTVSDFASFMTTIAAKASSAPASYHVIRLAFDTVTGASQMDQSFAGFSAGGGCLVLPADGHTPHFINNTTNSEAFAPKGKYLEFRNIYFGASGSPSNSAAVSVWQGSATAPPILKFKNCFVGTLYEGGKSLSDIDSFGYGIRVDWADQIIVEDCEFYGVRVANFVNRPNRFVARNNYYRVSYLFCHHMLPVCANVSTDGGVEANVKAANGGTYDWFYLIENNVSVGCPDMASHWTLATIPHCDYVLHNFGDPGFTITSKTWGLVRNNFTIEYVTDSLDNGSGSRDTASINGFITDNHAHSLEVLYFNNLFGSQGFAHQADPLNTNALVHWDCNTWMGPPQVRTAIGPDGLSGVAGTATNVRGRFANNMLRSVSVTSGSSTNNVTLSNYSSATGQQMSDLLGGSFTARGDGFDIWAASVLGVTVLATLDKTAIKTACAAQCAPKPAANGAGAKFA